MTYKSKVDMSSAAKGSIKKRQTRNHVIPLMRLAYSTGFLSDSEDCIGLPSHTDPVALPDTTLKVAQWNSVVSVDY